MGIGPKFSATARPQLGQPQAHRFNIEHVEQVGSNVVALITYPDATEWRGSKALVYRNVRVSDIEAAGKLDPHFLEKSPFPVPFARFEPTSAGLAYAIRLASILE